MILAGGDSTGIVVAAISAAAVVLGPLTVALVQINHIGKKTDAVEKQTGAIQVQVNGQMTAILEQLEAANEARLAAEVELARYKEREHGPTATP